MPAGKVGADDVVRSQTNVDLEQNPPAARPPPTIIVVEGSTNETPERALCSSVTGERRGRQHDSAPDDLGTRIVRESQKIVPSCEFARGLHRLEYRAPVAPRRAPERSEMNPFIGARVLTAVGAV